MLGLFAALVVIPMFALPPYLRAKRSEHWPTADGVICANWLRVSVGKLGRFYHPEIAFLYRVGGTEYRSSRISFGFERGQGQGEAQGILDRHPMGSAVKVYYDPADPSFGILQPGRNDEMDLLYKIDLCFIAIFGFSFVATWLWYHDSQEPNLRPTSSVDH